jgi:phosphopantetheine--protein transferase-like protein
MIRMFAAQASTRSPQQVRVESTAAGKPQLADMPSLNVSVSHSGGVVVAAACRSVPVGVDVECAPAGPSQPRRLAQRLFAQRELDAVRVMPDDLLVDWFASAWTIKEAVGKALGVGIWPALSQVVVGRDGALSEVRSGPPAAMWTVHQRTAPGGAEKIAVALPAPGVALSSVSALTLEAFAQRLAYLSRRARR